MFLCAVARHFKDEDGKFTSDGKLGCLAFVETRTEERSSRIRTADTLEFYAVNITKETYIKIMLDEVLPAIGKLWPERGTSSILMQQDNTPGHIKEADKDVVSNGQGYGWFIRLDNLPANLPDVNILDLWLFLSLQSHVYDYDMRTILDVRRVNKESFDAMDPQKLEDKFFVVAEVHGVRHDDLGMQSK